MKKFLIILLAYSVFVPYGFGSDVYTPIESCSYENNKYWIKILTLCPEGDIACNKVIYVGLDKSNGNYIVLEGKTVVSKSNNNFLYYEFKNEDTDYRITRNDQLIIEKSSKYIYSDNINLCN